MKFELACDTDFFFQQMDTAEKQFHISMNRTLHVKKYGLK